MENGRDIARPRGLFTRIASRSGFVRRKIEERLADCVAGYG